MWGAGGQARRSGWEAAGGSGERGHSKRDEGADGNATTYNCDSDAAIHVGRGERDWEGAGGEEDGLYGYTGHTQDKTGRKTGAARSWKATASAGTGARAAASRGEGGDCEGSKGCSKLERSREGGAPGKGGKARGGAEGREERGMGEKGLS